MRKISRQGLTAGEVKLAGEALALILAHGFAARVQRTKPAIVTHCSIIVDTYSMDAGNALQLELVRKGFAFIWTDGRGNAGAPKKEIEIICKLEADT